MVRGSLGDVTLTKSSVKGSYPLYAMPVPTLLSLDRWIPHQDLRDEGKVVEMTADLLKEKDVIFVSHQWVAFNHPDPGGEQLRALQTTLKNLIAGKHTVESNFALNAIYQTLDRYTAEMWQKNLPEMYVWFDYISIPQPGAVVDSASDSLKKELDTDGNGIIDQSELINAGTGKAAASSDHRLLSGNDQRVMKLVEELKAAVDSIPSYIERSSMLWILVPPCQHHDIEGSICDFNSWRDRGWCRMEFAAGKLASGEEMPIMVVKSLAEAPEFFNPCDTFKLCAARGNFTVDADRAAVNNTLSTMLKSKALYYAEEKNDLVLARFIIAFEPVFVPRDVSAAANVATTDDAGGAAESAVARMKRQLRWRGDEEEARWFEETGWSLLILACSMDDEAAVDELLALPEAERRRELNAKGKKLVVSPLTYAKMGAPKHRADPFCQLFCAYAEGMTALIAAMTFARPSIVTKLLDAGAQVKRDGLKCLGELPCHFRGSILAGRLDNTTLFLDRYPQYMHKANALGYTPLHFACMIGRTNDQVRILKALLERGATASLGKKSIFLGTPLQTLTSAYDADPTSIQLLIEAGARHGGAARMGLHPLLRWLIRPLSRMLGKDKGDKTNPMMYGMKKFMRHHPGALRFTPAHNVAARGDMAAMKVYSSTLPGVVTTVKDKHGKTALDVALETARAGSSSELVPRTIERLVREAETAQLAAGNARAAGAAKGVAKHQVAPEVSFPY